jgi:hypothetical protein
MADVCCPLVTVLSHPRHCSSPVSLNSARPCRPLISLCLSTLQPLGALSVVVCAILSHFFLKEKLSFFGWLGCGLCILGATLIALNSPEQASVTEIRPFMRLFIAPGFLVWASLLILTAVFAVFYLVPRYGKTHMLVHIGICSVIGGLSVSCTQGLGASVSPFGIWLADSGVRADPRLLL